MMIRWTQVNMVEMQMKMIDSVRNKGFPVVWANQSVVFLKQWLISVNGFQVLKAVSKAKFRQAQNVLDIWFWVRTTNLFSLVVRRMTNCEPLIRTLMRYYRHVVWKSTFPFHRWRFKYNPNHEVFWHAQDAENIFLFDRTLVFTFLEQRFSIYLIRNGNDTKIALKLFHLETIEHSMIFTLGNISTWVTFIGKDNSGKNITQQIKSHCIHRLTSSLSLIYFLVSSLCFLADSSASFRQASQA